MPAGWYSADGATFLATEPERIVASLAEQAARRFRQNEPAQLRAWREQLALLRSTLTALPDPANWRLLLEYPLLRLGRRADAVLLGARGIFVLEFKIGADRFDTAAREQAEDFALDLRDFHAGSRAHPIIPILVATAAPMRLAVRPLLLDAVAQVQDANAATLAPLLADLAASLPEPRTKLDTTAWEDAPYRPVPTIIEAACMLYSRHGVAEIAAARADADSLGRTSEAIADHLARAQAEGAKIAIFVTGIPGAGKTLCGLNACFGVDERRATFLTGNPTLVHVLREALARDAITAGADRRAARQRMEGVIQALPRFRDHYVPRDDPPAERVVIIDEAQRSWTADQAIRKSVDRTVQLTQSEPAHLLDIMARHDGWAAIIGLLGGGQEIHDGEGGLAAWGEALTARPGWRIAASPERQVADPRQRLPDLPGLRRDAALHLAVSIRAIRNPAGADWADAVLAGDAARARAIADAHPLPFSLTRDLAELRARLRASCRGTRRAGLLASSGASRLRAEGLGVEVPHMDAGAVARWFLDRFPADIRASDALETVATEFSVQGLELDYAGLAWDADLVRLQGREAWLVRAFRGTKWTIPRDEETIANRINAYRVLLTRARYHTVIWVPRGDAGDPTRDRGTYDGIAAFLNECGAQLTKTVPLAAEERKQALLF